MLKQTSKSIVSALLCMITLTACVVLYMLKVAEITPASRDWSTLDAISEADAPPTHPDPPGAVVVKNGQLHHTSFLMTAASAPKPAGAANRQGQKMRAQ